MRTLGIILAGGKSTRLYPATLATTKQLLPVFDKPLIYYPLTTLMLLGIRDYVIITVPAEKSKFQKLFENSSKELGINITFATQKNPRGIPDAFNIARDWVDISKYDKTVLILGDNIFYGSGMRGQFADLIDSPHPSVVLKKVLSADASKFGIADIQNGRLASIVEKPTNPGKENWAVTGLYFYPRDVYKKVASLTPSSRGETEITDLNNLYIAEGRLNYAKLLRGIVWFDTGSPKHLLDASNLIRSLHDQGIVVGNPHEIAYNNGWVDEETINEAKKLNVRQMMWQVLDWNEPALNFYKKFNAELDSEWINGKLRFEKLGIRNK